MGSKCIILSRVSTLSQDLIQQTEEVKKTAKNDGYSDSDIIFIEDKESGVKLDEEHRLGLNKLKDLINEDPNINCVYVYELSRIGRRPEVNYSIRNFLKEKKVQLIILNPKIQLFKEDFSIDESSNMLFSLFNSLAENEGFLRKARFKRGRQNSIKNMKYIGGRVLFGFKVLSDKSIVVDPERAEYVKKMFKGYASETLSMNMIAKEMYDLGYINTKTLVGCASVVRRHLKSRQYLGEHEEGKYAYPPLIDVETFNKVQEVMQKNKNAPKKQHKVKAMLRKKIHDKVTGLRLSVHHDYYLIHKNYMGKDGKEGKRNLCIKMDFMDDCIWNLLLNRSDIGPYLEGVTNKDTQKKISDLEKKIFTLRNRLSRIEKEKDKINERIVLGRMREEYGDELIDKLEEERVYSELRLSSMETELMNLQIYDTFLGTAPIGYDWKEEKDIEKKGEIVDYYIKDIIIEKGFITVVWRDGLTENFRYYTPKKIFEKIDQ